MTSEKYKVLMDFTEPETEDKFHKNIKDRIYRKGQEFPHDGYTPTEERIKYLTSAKCMKGNGPVIEAAGMRSVSSMDNRKG